MQLGFTFDIHMYNFVNLMAVDHLIDMYNFEIEEIS
jgi:hypothetical protein